MFLAALIARLVVPLTGVAVIYVIYMFEVDVPMYWARWVADASGRWVVSHRWADWESEVVWMSLYFSAAVFVALVMLGGAWVVLAGPALWMRLSS